MKPDTLLAKIVVSGWVSLSLSTAMFFVGTHWISIETEWVYAIWMMTARLLGFCAFVIGALSIFNHYWLNGALLFMGSVALPVVSLFVYGKL